MHEVRVLPALLFHCYRSGAIDPLSARASGPPPLGAVTVQIAPVAVQEEEKFALTLERARVSYDAEFEEDQMPVGDYSECAKISFRADVAI